MTDKPPANEHVVELARVTSSRPPELQAVENVTWIGSIEIPPLSPEDRSRLSIMDLAPYPSDDEWIEGFHPDWLPGEPEVAERGPSLIVAAFLLFAAFLFGLACGGVAVAIVRGMRP